MMKKKKVLYISNVDLEGSFLPGVINKINGQEAAFKNRGFEIDILYPTSKDMIVIKKFNEQKFFYKGGKAVSIYAPKYLKFIHHLKVAYYGNIDFSHCFSSIIKEKYDAIYLRFFVPGRNLLIFIKKIKLKCPNILIFLEYPTLKIRELFRKDPVRMFAYRVNYRRIKQMNKLSDYIITLTKDKTLFGKPTIHMPNGIDLRYIKAVPVPLFADQFNLLGIASDVIISHGFDRVIRGIAEYVNKPNLLKINFTLISNPHNKIVHQLKSLTKELNIDKFINFELSKTKDELADVYKNVHVCIGTLAQHRIGLKNSYSLKHREYAAFGIPFVMSKGDDHFEHSPFVHIEEENDNPLDIQRIIDFYISIRQNYPDYPRQFRKSVESLITWDIQMKGIFSVIEDGKPEQVV